MQDSVPNQDTRPVDRKPLLNRAEAADLLGVSQRTIRRYELQGLLPTVRLNRRMIRYRRIDIENMCEKFLAMASS